MTTTKPRPHADLIKLWADGADIQYRKGSGCAWVDCADPAWCRDYEYRVKPREYPKTMMSGQFLRAEFHRRSENELSGRLEDLANVVLRHAIDSGQVVPMNEVQEVARNLARQEVEEKETLRHLRPVKFP